MAFELVVEYRAVPTDVVTRWRSEFEKLGAMVEFYPDFSLQTWGGGFLPMKLMIPTGSSLPSSERFASGPLSGGCEVDFHQGAAAFRTPMGRTVAEFCTQVLGAAAFAAATGGKYIDPQSGREAAGSEVVRLALDEFRSFAEGAGSHEWDNVEFPGWAAFQ